MGVGKGRGDWDAGDGEGDEGMRERERDRDRNHLKKYINLTKHRQTLDLVKFPLQRRSNHSPDLAQSAYQSGTSVFVITTSIIFVSSDNLC